MAAISLIPPEIQSKLFRVAFICIRVEVVFPSSSCHSFSVNPIPLDAMGRYTVGLTSSCSRVQVTAVTAVTCTREQHPLVTPMSAHHRSEKNRTATSAPRVEDVMSLRPGVARVMRPDSESRCGVAHGAVDYIGLPIRPVAAAGVTGSPTRSVADSPWRLNTPPGGLVGAVLHGRGAGWSFPLRRR